MGRSSIQKAQRKLARLLEEASIPYAIVGALGLAYHGYRRLTEDVYVLLTPTGLEAFKARHLGLGYVEKFPGSRGLRDTEHEIPIDVIVTGQYPGDGKPKPVAFPDPAEVAIRGEEMAFLPLPLVVELELASGITAPHRLKDLADVLELIRTTQLSEELSQELSPFVRDKYLELWQAAQEPQDE